MKLLPAITHGKAVIVDGGLRCAKPRKVGNKEVPCNKLLMYLNSLGQAAGDLKCDRCGQQVVVELVPAR